jgi:hypothetical protein
MGESGQWASQGRERGNVVSGSRGRGIVEVEHESWRSRVNRNSSRAHWCVVTDVRHGRNVCDVRISSRGHWRGTECIKRSLDTGRFYMRRPLFWGHRALFIGEFGILVPEQMLMRHFPSCALLRAGKGGGGSLAGKGGGGSVAGEGGGGSLARWCWIVNMGLSTRV